MLVVKFLKKICEKYGNSLKRTIDIPEFLMDEVRRYRVIFSGIVQGVGFRYETWLIAQKLGLTGFAKNLPNGDVYVEVQGAKNRVQYLIQYMKSNDRIHIENMEIDEMELKEEKEFTPIY